MRAWSKLIAVQALLVVGAVLVYFGVRGQTEGSPGIAHANAADLLALERRLGIDLETAIQRAPLAHDAVLDLANWTYIWLHWPLLISTLIWLLVRHRDHYTQLRNAIFISGAIGMVIFATFPVAPPRLFSAEFIDTVTQNSHSYRVLQPPSLVNKYAALPSLHVGWNLLAAIGWWRVSRRRWWRVAATVMPLAMAWATVATANHWVLDVLAGAAIALTGLAIEQVRVRRRDRRAATAPVPAADEGVCFGPPVAVCRSLGRHDVVPAGVRQRCDRAANRPAPTPPGLPHVPR